MQRYWRRISSWFQRHTGAAVTGIIVVVILAVGAAIFLVSLGGARDKVAPTPTRQSEEFEGAASQGVTDGDISPSEGSGGRHVEIKEGQMSIESDNAARDASRVREEAEQHNGHVEESNKRETNTRLRISLTARVPSDNFEGFTKALREQFDVKDYSIRNVRLPVQRELDELSIITQSMEDYQNIREEIKSMETGEEKIQLLMKVTDNELELQQRKKNFERQLSGKQRRSDLATLTVRVEEKKVARMLPEDVGNRFRDRMKDAIDTSVDAGISVVAGGVALLANVIKWIVYAIIVVVPVAFVYRYAKRFYRRWWPADEREETAKTGRQNRQ